MKSVTTAVCSSDGRNARWDQHRRNRKRDLLRSIRHVISEIGPGASMETLAQELDTSKTILYRYFGDRAGLETAMSEWAMRAILRELDQVDTLRADAHEALRSLISAFVYLAARSPHVYRFCDRGVSAEVPHGASFFLAVTDLLCDRMQLTTRSHRMWARGAVGFVRSCTEEWLSAPDSTAAEFSEQITAWLLQSAPTEPTQRTAASADTHST